jgi:SAM-dependent methyltransferase
VGCGTGRLLVRCLREGLVFHGIDTSADMLSRCRAKAQKHGLEAKLFLQPMEALDLPDRYATIFVACGSFMLHLDDQSAVEALRRFHKHLAPNGVVVLTFFEPNAPPDPSLGCWEQRATGTMPDGPQVTMDQITDRYDPELQIIECRRKYSILRDELPVSEEYLIDRYRWYSVDHVTRLPESGGIWGMDCHR